MKHGSIADLAADLGVSPTAVSIALGGRQGVSVDLRERIRAHAEKRGYRPNTIAQELMSLVRANRRKTSVDVLAFLNTFGDPGLLLRIQDYRKFFEGASRRARDYGYRLDEFRGRAPGMTPARLGRILRARGVRGVIIGPHAGNEHPLDLDLSGLSVVTVGERIFYPKVSCVSNDHTHATRLAVENLALLGYSRIGGVFIHEVEATRDFEFLLGLEQFRRLHGGPPLLRSFLYHEHDFQPRVLETWIRKEKLDAVISLAPEPWEVVSRLRAPDGRPLGYANLSLKADKP